MKKIFVPHVTEKDTHSPDRESPLSVPHRVKVLAIIALGLLLLFAFFRFPRIVGNLASPSEIRMSTPISLASRVHGGRLL